MASDNLDSDVNNEEDLQEKACVYPLEESYPEGSKPNEKRVMIIRRKAAKFEVQTVNCGTRKRSVNSMESRLACLVQCILLLRAFPIECLHMMSSQYQTQEK